MRVLVTGGAGFIGGTLTHALVAAGADVTVVDDLSTGTSANLHPAAELVALDIMSPELARVVAQASPEAVVHLAAQVSVAASVADPAFDRLINVDGTRLVAGAAVAAGARRMLFASSAAVYGDPVELPLTEQSCTTPTVPYGDSKLAAETVLREVLAPAGVDFAALRLANVYGPRQRTDGEGGVVAQFASRMVAGTPPVIFGSGAQTRDFIFVGDVVSAFVRALEHEGPLALPGPAGAAYNISTGRSTSVTDLADGLREATGYTGPIERAGAREGDVAVSVLDPAKAERELGWRATADLRSGLARTAASFART